MALNRDFVGRTRIAPDTYEVSREKIREYAVAIGDPHPACLDVDAAKALGHPDVVAPPNFVLGVFFRLGSWPLTDPDFGKNKKPFIVLREQHVTHHRPLRPGDRLTLTTTVDEVRTLRTHELLTLSHEIRTDDGEHICTITDRAVSRGTAEPTS